MRPKHRRDRWSALLDALVSDCKEGNARRQTYWAQQLAFGPVLVHALALRLRNPCNIAERGPLLEVLELARAALGTLPERPGITHRDLARLAARQAVALARGRRRQLDRLITRLDGSPPAEGGEPVVPSRMLRAYPLVSWAGEGSSATGG